MRPPERVSVAPSCKERLLAFLFPMRCRSCGALLPLRTVLCEGCMREYRTTLSWECGLCGLPPARCTCTNEYLARMRVRRHIKLFRYQPDAIFPAANRLLYYAKHAPCRATARFFAEQLAESVRSLVPDYREFFVCFAPRTPRERRRHGFDQSEMVARALAAELDIPFCACLARHTKVKRQRDLADTAARIRNAADTVFLRHTPPMRRALLVDDIVTTGATMAECARALRKNGVREVVAVSSAFVAHNPNQKYEEENRVP